MKKSGAILCLVFVLACQISAQKAQIEVKDKVHDFGEIKEESGDVNCSFEVKNTGDAPLVISRVVSACACILPKWTNAAIAPNATGVVKVTYHAKGRPGTFSKNVTIHSNAANNEVIVMIKGNVLPASTTPSLSTAEEQHLIAAELQTFKKKYPLGTSLETEFEVKYSGTHKAKYVVFDINDDGMVSMVLAGGRRDFANYIVRRRFNTIVNRNEFSNIVAPSSGSKIGKKYYQECDGKKTIAMVYEEKKYRADLGLGYGYWLIVLNDVEGRIFFDDYVAYRDAKYNGNEATWFSHNGKYYVYKNLSIEVSEKELSKYWKEYNK